MPPFQADSKFPKEIGGVEGKHKNLRRQKWSAA